MDLTMGGAPVPVSALNCFDTLAILIFVPILDGWVEIFYTYIHTYIHTCIQHNVEHRCSQYIYIYTYTYIQHAYVHFLICNIPFRRGLGLSLPEEDRVSVKYVAEAWFRVRIRHVGDGRRRICGTHTYTYIHTYIMLWQKPS